MQEQWTSKNYQVVPQRVGKNSKSKTHICKKVSQEQAQEEEAQSTRRTLLYNTLCHISHIPDSSMVACMKLHNFLIY